MSESKEFSNSENPDGSGKTRAEAEQAEQKGEKNGDRTDESSSGFNSLSSEREPSQSDSHARPQPAFLLFLRIAFFLSGFAALVYEVVWQRVLVRLVGESTPAVSAIVCSFMAGLLIGSLFAPRLIRRTTSISALVRLMAIVEFLIAIAGVISVNLCKTSFIQSSNDLFLAFCQSNGSLLAVLSTLVAFLLMLVPTSLMGATVPIMAALSGSLEYPRPRSSSDAESLKTSDGSLKLSQLLRGSSTHELAYFYAFNTTGAVFGALFAGLQFLPSLGVSQSIYCASAINVLASVLSALAAFLFSATSEVNIKPGERNTQRRADSPDDAKDSAPHLMVVSGVVLICGSLSMSMQIVWTRFLVLIFGSSTFALSVVLAIFIAGLALGAWLIALMVRRVRDKGPLFSFLIAVTAVLLGAVQFQYQQLPALYLTSKKWLLDFFAPGLVHDSISMIVCASWLILPAATLMGTIFPLALECAADIAGRGRVASDGDQREQGILSRQAARLYALNLVGCLFGSLGTGLFTLPAMAQYFLSGIEVTTILVACFYILLAFIVAFSMQPDSKVALKSLRDVIFLTAFAFALVILRPAWNPALMSSGIAFVSSDELRRYEVANIIDVMSQKTGSSNDGLAKVLFYREGINSTVAVGSRPDANLNYLKNNGKTEASLPIDPFLPAPQSDMPTQTLLGLLPAVLSLPETSGAEATGTPGANTLEGLVIGYGSGTTCGALLNFPWVRRVTAVELEDAVWASDRFFQPTNGNPLRREWVDARRMNQVTVDARNFLSTHPEQFDFIVSQAAEPWLSGSADLYTREFFELSSRRLKKQGIFCQWLPLYSLNNAKLKILLRTFHSVYPNVFVWHPRRSGELILTGSSSAERRVIDFQSLSNSLNKSEVIAALERIGIDNQYDLISCMFGSPDTLQADVTDSTLVNTDDNLIVELEPERELPPDEFNIDLRLSNLWSKRSADQVGQPQNGLDRALALAYAKRKRFESAPFSDIYYYGILDGSPLDRRPPPPLAAPSFLSPARNIFKNDSGSSTQSKTDEEDKALLDFRYWLYMGDAEKAMRSFKDVSAEKATTYDGLCDVATGYLMKSEFDQSASLFARAQALRKGARAQAGVGLSYWLLKKDKQSEPLLRSALSQDPNQFLARYALAQLLCKSGKQEEGLRNMRMASRINPGSPLPGIFVTAFYIEQENYAAAADNLHLVMRRQNALLPEAVALGYLIAEKTKRSPDLLNSFAQRYRKLAGKDITVESSKQIALAILREPFGLRSFADPAR